MNHPAPNSANGASAAPFPPSLLNYMDPGGVDAADNMGSVRAALEAVRAAPLAQPSTGALTTLLSRLKEEAFAETAPSATGPSATGPSATGPSATRPSATGPSAAGPSAAGSKAADLPMADAGAPTPIWDRIGWSQDLFEPQTAWTDAPTTLDSLLPPARPGETSAPTATEPSALGARAARAEKAYDELAPDQVRAEPTAPERPTTPKLPAAARTAPAAGARIAPVAQLSAFSCHALCAENAVRTAEIAGRLVVMFDTGRSTLLQRVAKFGDVEIAALISDSIDWRLDALIADEPA